MPLQLFNIGILLRLFVLLSKGFSRKKPFFNALFRSGAGIYLCYGKSAEFSWRTDLCCSISPRTDHQDKEKVVLGTAPNAFAGNCKDIFH
jgi:hypothetical protein